MRSHRLAATSLLMAGFAVAAALSGCVLSSSAALGFVPPPRPAPDAVAGGGGVVAVQAEIHIDFFGVPLDGAQDVVFVLDRSGSMASAAVGVAGSDVGLSAWKSTVVGLGARAAGARSKMEAAKAELIATLDEMPDGTRFNIVFFDSNLAELSPRMLVLSAQTRALARAFIQRISPGSSTAAVPAMQFAYQIGAARVVLLSDGLANTGGGAETLLSDARREIRRGVRIDTVGLGIDQDAELLRTLAAESGGVSTTY